MSAKTTQTLARLLVLAALLLLWARYSHAAPLPDYLTELLAGKKPLAPLPMLPIYRAPATPAPRKVAPVKKPAPKAVTPGKASRAQQAKNGAAIMAWLRAHLGLRESTGYNRDPLIDSWARRAGNALASEWCGLTQMADQIAQALTYPSGPAGSYNWFLPGSPRNVLRGTTGSFDSARVGYRVGIFNARRGRISHITAVDEVYTKRQGNRARGAWCIGGNEGSGKNAGVHRTFYPAANIYALSNWNY